MSTARKPTRLWQGKNPESRTDTSVSPLDFEGGKLPIDGKRRSKFEETLYLETYNIRTMRLDEQPIDLQHELQKSVKEAQWQSGHHPQIWTIIVSKELGYKLIHRRRCFTGSQNRIHLVTKAGAVSSRIIYVMIRIYAIFIIQIIQPYATIFASPDEEIATAKNAEKTKICVIIGDYNTKIGAKDGSFLHR